MPDTSNENNYLALLVNILHNGTRKKNRTGVDTIGILGTQSRYDLRKGFPLFTTKEVWMKGIVHELLWFLSGSQNIKYLVDNGVNIWNDDAYRKYKSDLEQYNNASVRKSGDRIGLLSKEDYIKAIKENPLEKAQGDLGPVYGSQWRKWAFFRDELVGHEEIDQVANLVDGLKNNPDSRRHILTAWNPPQIEDMGLPPCHVMSQYSVVDGVLHSHMYQRSCDMFLGVPFNVASYALLTHMLAQVCGLKVGEFIHTMHDAHIYESHIDQVKEQLGRVANAPPTLKLNYKVDNIDLFVYDDIKIEGYNPHPKIRAPLITTDITK